MIRVLVFCCCAVILASSAFAAEAKRPNVVVVITDDQGYGEIAAHGNTVIRTPNMDTLHGESVRLTDFHVDPTCSPTRRALLTGRYSTRTGVWHTINGRSMLHPAEVTLAEVFKANGYRTGMVGKWHLGDSYPCRPSDQGFEHVVWHKGGGVGNGPDYWKNDYFDDTYMVNGTWQRFKGYCTDVWFREATKFVEKNVERNAEKNTDAPFFLYLSTNAPHGPWLVDDKYAKPYREAGLPATMAKFYGMIENIDENLGRFRKKLDALGLAENTLLVFMTDNGTTAGWIDQKAGYKYFNAGMRGWKGSAWDGGHRVRCYFHWPAGGLKKGRDVDALTAHIDLLPTLVDLVGLDAPKGRGAVDGVSLRSLLAGEKKKLPERTLFTHVQRSELPPKWERSAAMTERWRLVDGTQLYDIVADSGQKKDVAADHPEVVKRLRADYEKWWASLKEDMKQTVRYGLGGKKNPTLLTSHDWLMPGTKQAVWHQGHVRGGSLINGPWAVEVEQAGEYEVTLFRWAPYLERAMEMKSARIKIGKIDETIDMKREDASATFRVKLPAGPAMLKGTLVRPDGKSHGAYYVRVELVGDGPEGKHGSARSAN